jgi:penicillin amidase
MQELKGPRGPIQMRRDRWGTPTLWVHDEEDAAWATGWMHATDRFIQAQLAIVVGQGRLMEVVGDQTFARRIDRATRQLRFTEGLDEAVERLSPAMRAWMEAYCAGFEAAAAARGGSWTLRAVGWRPPTWTPAVVLLLHRVLSWFGLTSTSQIAKAALGELLCAGVDPRALQALLGPDAAGVDPAVVAGLRWPGDDAVVGFSGPGGSNAFAISGRRTRSGGAIVLAEFHMEVARIPPVLYPVDLRYADGRYLLGMTIPGDPHVLAGRNRDVAWAYTFGHGDNIDLTVEDCVAGGVRVGARTEPVTRREVRVRRRGKGPETWLMHDLPDHRALLSAPAPGGPALALAWRGLGRPEVDHEVLFGARTARTVDELVALHRRVRTLATNAVFGDRSGRIASMVTGVVAAHRAGVGPRRRPDPDPDLPEVARPVRVDPPEGFVASANEASPGWTAFPEPPYRRQRLDELLAAEGTWDLDRASRVTYDEVDRGAERWLRAWSSVLPESPELQALAAAVVGADAGPRRRACLRAHVIHQEASRAVLSALVGAPRADALIEGLGLLLVLQHGLDDVLCGEHPDVLSRDELRAALREAVPRAAAGEGPTVDQAPFRNLLVDVDVATLVGMHTRPVRFPGTPTSLFQARRVPAFGQELVGGPAFHLLMDMGADGGQYNTAGGASERRFGPGYGQGLDAWSEGRFEPIGPR